VTEWWLKPDVGTPLISCPCGCSLRTLPPGVQLCGCCKKMRAWAHWDSLYDICDGCAWCWSLGHAEGDGNCCHGECYEPIAQANARTDKYVEEM